MQTTQLLLLDSRSASSDSSWIATRPHVVVMLLEALASVAGEEGGRDRLVRARAPRLVVECMAAAGHTVAGGGSGGHSAVVESAQRLGRAMLEGGFAPAQEALLGAAESNGQLMAVVARELAGLPTALSTKQDSAGGSSSDAGGAQSWEGGLTLLQFVQQCCEGHNARFQDAFREQAGSATQHDIVTAIVQLLGRMCIQAGPWWTVLVYWDAWYEHADLAVHAAALLQTIETLTEMLQGPNRTNQRIACDSRLLETVTWILDACRKSYFHCGVYTQPIPDDNDYGSWQQLQVCTEADLANRNDGPAAVADETYNLVGGKSRQDLLLELQYKLLGLVQALVEAAPSARASKVAAGTMLQLHGPFLLGRLTMAASMTLESDTGESKGQLQSSGAASRSLHVDTVRVSGESFGQLAHSVCAEDVLLQWICTVKLLCVQVGMHGELLELADGAS